MLLILIGRTQGEIMEKSYKLPHNVYLILFGLGVIIHYVFLGIWLTLHDFQVAFFLKLIFHSLISLLLVADLILSAIVVLMFSFYNLSFTKFS